MFNFLERVLTRARASRWYLIGLIASALVFLLVFFLGSVTLLHFTESTAFCSSCHIMSPEVTTHDISAHANTDCGTCHVGPGAVPALKAKLDNVQYLWRYPLHLYEKPLPVPVTSMRPVQVVCYQCHWPQKFYADKVLELPAYAEDDQNTLTQTQLVLRTGGGSTSANLGRGIHWHIENPVYYIATDSKLQVIPWVQATYNGKTTTYVSTDSTLTPEQIASAQKRQMDCLDCHNRATHIYERPTDALDAAMNNGSIPADLPYVKREGVQVLEKTYASNEEAAAAIAATADFWKTNYPDLYASRKADVDKVVAGYQNIYDTTQFPFMDVTWETYPNNIGHADFPGCFRCHDGKHLSSDNQAIRIECNLCHSIPQVTTAGQTLPVALPSTIQEPESHHSTTWLSEHRFQFNASCATCHDVSNPGGSDNSSFCSNSACHGADWKFAGLNAPQVRELGAPPEVESTGQPPAIPHPIGPGTDCLLCHAAGKVRPFPDSHAGYTINMCTGCHQPTLQESAPAAAATPAAGTTVTPIAGATAAPTDQAAPAAGGPPAIPHALDAAHENCLLCHGQDSSIKPAPQDHAGRTVDQCQLCHKLAATAPSATATSAGVTPTVQATAAAATPAPTTQATAAPAAGGPPAIPHALDAAHENCLLCHGQDSSIKPAPQDHAGRTVDQCQLCHKPA